MRRRHALNHLLTPSAPHPILNCMERSTRRPRHHAHLRQLGPSRPNLRSTCRSWSRHGQDPPSPVHHVRPSAVTREDHFRPRRRCRRRLLPGLICTTSWSSSIRAARSGLTSARGRRYLPKGSGVYTNRILITSSRTHLQKGRSRTTVTNFPYQRWRAWTSLASRTPSYSPRKPSPSDGVLFSPPCAARQQLINACSGNGVLSLCSILIVFWHWIAHPHCIIYPTTSLFPVYDCI